MSEPLEFRIHGMDCADEVAILRRAIGPIVETPERLSFDLLRGKMIVRPGSPHVDTQTITMTVAATGMRAEPWRDATPDAAETGFWQRRRRTILTALSGLLSLTAFAIHGLTAGWIAALGSEGAGLAETTPPISIALYVSGIVAGGWFVVPRALASSRRLRPDMNLLMTVAVIGAAAIGEWFEAAVVTFLFALSLALESWSVNRARRAVEALLAIAPPTARLIQPDSSDREVPAVDVVVGAHIRVKPGDRLPLDGTVRVGTSHVNQAPITGESLPVEKAPGSEVFAGTVNGDGVLDIEVTRLVGETTLAQIIRMVEWDPLESTCRHASLSIL